MENKVGIGNKFVSSITSQSVDFAKWYTDVCIKAELMDYSDVKGFIIYRPYGYAIWEGIQKYLDTKFKNSGHENLYMPLLIPASLFNLEKEHVEGFAPEVASVTHIHNEPLSDELIIRPTSEVLFCSHFKKIVSSYRDLPKKYNQWCSVVRWEKSTRPFLRGKEFLWQEGHTIHSSSDEAKCETLSQLEVYKDMGKELLSIPFTTGKKTEKEKFAGAINTYAIEALMPDGQALQSGTSHYFGQNFSIPFDIKFQNVNNTREYVYQTSWGVSTRLIGALIMCHGDDNGLSLPPMIAPIQVVIIPIKSSLEIVRNVCTNLKNDLLKLGIRVLFDDSDRTPGWKFSEYEMKGVPLRIEVGPKDIEANVVSLTKRYNFEKSSISLSEVSSKIPLILTEIQKEMYLKVESYTSKKTYIAKTYSEFIEYSKLGYVKMSIALEAEQIISNETNATARIILEDEPLITEYCPVTKKKAIYTVLFARAY
jgi:prolyl-tRNA synthetase